MKRFLALKILLPVALFLATAIPLTEIQMIVSGTIWRPLAPYFGWYPLVCKDKAFYVTPYGSAFAGFFWAVVIYLTLSLIQRLLRKPRLTPTVEGR
jgi:hypothetical protein